MLVTAGHGRFNLGSILPAHGVRGWVQASITTIFNDWFARAVWDDRVLTSVAWRSFADWAVNGVWFDGVPLTAGTWLTPTGDAATFSVWDDGVSI